MFKIGRILIGAARKVKAGKRISSIAAGLTTRAGRKKAFNSALQLGSLRGKKQLAKNAGKLALGAGVSGLAMSLFDSSNTKTDDQKLAQLKEELMSEFPELAAAQTLGEAMDILKYRSVVENAGNTEEAAIADAFRELVNNFLLLDCLHKHGHPTERVISRRIDESDLEEKYYRHIKASSYLCGYYFGLFDCLTQLEDDVDEPRSFLDYFLYGAAAGRNGTDLKAVIAESPVRDSQLSNLDVALDSNAMVEVRKDIAADGIATPKEFLSYILDNLF